MKTEAVADPQEFLTRAADVLADEARHNLILGVVHTIIRSPDVYPDYRLYVVSEGGAVVAAAAMTLPYNMLIADALVDDAVAPLAAEASAADKLPGIIGNRPTIDRFAQEWEMATGGSVDVRMEQGVFALHEVAPVPAPPGSPRVANQADYDTIERWMLEFTSEALPDELEDPDRMRKAIIRRLGGEVSAAYWIWERDDEPVSLSGHGSPTGSGIRIGSVYTPQRLRGNGYASALVAAESQWLLDNGYRFCFLHTNLANPTSNAIYKRIGYRQVSTSRFYRFGD